MPSLALFWLSLWFGTVPMQVRHVGGVVLERHADPCTGLDASECCAQLLAIAGFRATGDQLPRAAKTPVRLSCEVPQKIFPETSCRLLALSRGFAAKDVSELCAPATLEQRCRADDECKQCSDELGKLSFRGAHRACYALTYVGHSPRGAPRVARTSGDGSANPALARTRRAPRQ